MSPVEKKTAQGGARIQQGAGQKKKKTPRTPTQKLLRVL